MNSLLNGSARRSLRALAATALTVAMVSGAAAEQAPQKILITSGTPTGSWFPTAAAIAEMVNKDYDGQPVEAIVGAGSVGNIFHVKSGKSEMGLSYGAFLRLAQEGGNDVNPGEPMPELRAVMGLIPYALHVFAAEGKDFNQLTELTRQKPALNLGVGVTGATEHFGLGLVLKAYGASYEDLESWGGRITQTQTAGRKQGWQNRQFDWASFMGTLPAVSYFDLLEARESKLISFTDEVRDTLARKYGFAKYDIPAGTYPNQTEEWQTVGFPMVLFATSDVSDEMVYRMVKYVAENKDRMVKATAAFEAWSPEDMVDSLGVDVHEGAARYYRERGWM